MNDVQLQELNFWRQVLLDVGPENYDAYRRADFEYHFGNYQGQCDLSKGQGLEIGVGLGSLLQYAKIGEPYYAVDPLMDVYLDMWEAPEHNEWWPYRGDGENLKLFGCGFDWIVNWNVIDHTPHPEKMVAAMHQRLVDGGKLYLYLNFDDTLSGCHYALWNGETVVQYFDELFRITWESTVRVEEHHQTKYYAVLEKR